MRNEWGCAVPNAPKHPSPDAQARSVQQRPAPICQPCTPGAPLPTCRLSSRLSPASSCALTSLCIAHGELLSPAPAPCGTAAGSHSSRRDPVERIPFQGFSSAQTSSDGETVPKRHILLVCLFIPILMETLTLGNHWGDANDDHLWDGPQQRVMDCPWGPAQLNQPLPAPPPPQPE